MREILFRGFHPNENGKTVITLNGEKIKGEWVYWNIFGRTNTEIRVTVSGGYYTTYRVDIEHIIPETIGEYTGLTDKNGEQIFEGDTVAVCDLSTGYTKRKTYTVEYDKNICGYWFYHNSGDIHFVEVIGNIYDNKES